MLFLPNRSVFMMKMRMYTVLAVCLIFGSCSSRGPKDRDGTFCPGVPDVDSHVQLLDAVSKLQANPWEGWPVGTLIVVGYADSSQEYQNVKHYAQPNMTYRVIGDGTTFGRGQGPDGEVSQFFEVANEVGLPSPPELPSAKAKQTQLVIDGIVIECNEIQSTFELFPGPRVTTTYWVAQERPEVLLKRKNSDGDYWQVEGFATQRIGGEEYRCVKTRQRMSTYDGYVVTLEYLHSTVPGHLVQRVKEFHSGNSTADRPVLTMVSREHTIRVDIPKSDTEHSPVGDSLEAAPDE